jgi:hypothetical protein
MAIIKGIKVGTTEITSSYTNGNTQSDSKELTVNAVSFQDVSGSISAPNDTVYTGSAITPTPTVTVVLDGVVTTLTLGTDYTLSYSNNTNTGTATVTATGIGNYTGTLSASWTIVGADIAVTANDQSYEYDGNLHGSPITVITVNNQTATIRYRTTSSGEYNLTSAPQFRNVVNSGYNGIVYFKVTAPNHNDYTGSYHLEISPLEAVLSWGTLEWTYDGNEHSTTCTVSNLVSGDTCMVTLSGNSITNIGSTTVTATGLSNSNYSLPSDVTRTLVIAAGLFVKLSGVWTPVKKVYKKVSGHWVQQEFGSAFSTSEMYKKMN